MGAPSYVQSLVSRHRKQKPSKEWRLLKKAWKIGPLLLPQHPTALLARLKQTILKRLMRSIIDKQILTVVPTIDYVVHPIRPFDS